MVSITMGNSLSAHQSHRVMQWPRVVELSPFAASDVADYLSRERVLEHLSSHWQLNVQPIKDTCNFLYSSRSRDNQRASPDQIMQICHVQNYLELEISGKQNSWLFKELILLCWNIQMPLILWDEIKWEYLAKIIIWLWIHNATQIQISVLVVWIMTFHIK